MSCAHHLVAGGETIFAIDAAAITFGRGAIHELGDVVKSLGGKRVAVFTDPRIEFVHHATKSLTAAGIDHAVYSEVSVEPTDKSFMAAAAFAREGKFDAYVSVGGGSVIDTCKAAALYATYPAAFLDYVNAPVGAGRPVPGTMPIHVACPTTCGTGSELTGIAICDVLSLHVKTGIASRAIRPTRAIVDPDATATLPAGVVAASGFDVLCHALESYTARPFASRAAGGVRPMSQGRNPWSDVGSREALRLGGKFLVRAVTNASDTEAREGLMWAATLAGVAFGNAGVHIPHAMAYAVAGLTKDFQMPGYPKPFVPHGVSVIVNAPSAFRFTEAACPERHLECAQLLGGESLSDVLTRLMREASVPVDLKSMGYRPEHTDALVKGTSVQKRLLDNAPRPVTDADLRTLFEGAM